MARFAGRADANGEVAADATVLDTWFPVVNGGSKPANAKSAALLAAAVGHTSGSGSYRLSGDQIADLLAIYAPYAHEAHRHGNLISLQMGRDVMAQQLAAPRSPHAMVVTFLGDLDAAPVDAHDAYLRLHLLSHRAVQPHGLNLSGVFGLLTNCAWTSIGPFEATFVNCIRGQCRAMGLDLNVTSVDKFPRMTDYIVPGGVRIADADRVRLGAHLAEGTTIMHEGFVNFNAGTLGTSMVEGRISAGVVIGDGSDVGGGASIMGTLSGGGQEVIRVGAQCLLGANSGLGISLGDRCTIEAGLYVTAGSKSQLPRRSCQSGLTQRTQRPVVPAP